MKLLLCCLGLFSQESWAGAGAGVEAGVWAGAGEGAGAELVARKGAVLGVKEGAGGFRRSRRFAQFEDVNLAEVWNELKSSKVVSYTLARDITVVSIMTTLSPVPFYTTK